MSIILQDSHIKQINNKNIVLIGGCFDIIHPGHIQFLESSKKYGDILILLLESDENIKKIKGESRPLNNQVTRAENLSKLEIVDYIILLKTPKSSNYYYNLVNLLRPAIIAVTVGDPLLEIKKDQAKIVGGKVVEVMERDTRHSSTEKIKNISI